MSANNTPSWWSSILGMSTVAQTPSNIAKQAITTTGTTAVSGYTWPLYATGISQIPYGAASSSISYSVPELTPDVAAELLTQFEDDRALLDDKGRLKFGKYRHKRLCKADLKYLVALGRAINKVRQGIAKDVRARRALARITQ